MKRIFPIVICIILVLSNFTFVYAKEITDEYIESTDHNSFETILKPVNRVKTDVDTKILDKAKERKKAIRNSSTDIAVTGTVYYISTSGNDNDSGTSPDRAWKTISKVNSKSLSSGDTIFFKRGDTWRGECLLLREGVTYSAYGTGNKPAIYGSPENGAGTNKWKLLSGTNNIWVFYKDVLECGTIVLNDKEGAFKINAFSRNGQYVDENGKKFDVKTALSTNHSFYSYDDLFLEADNAWERDRNPGPLYLRCDEGNPGTVFNSIEFNTWTNTENGNKGLLYADDKGEGQLIRDPIIIDNLTLKYTGGYGIYLNSASAFVQNCEIGWIGGCTTNCNSDFVGGSGNCVGNFGDIDNYNITNCYLYQAYDSGISNEGSFTHKNINYSGNLIEDCLFGIEMHNSLEQYSCLQDTKITDNMIIDSGYGFGSVRQYRRWNIYDAAIIIHPYYDDVKNVLIKDNIFYRSKGYLIICGSAGKPTFSSNSYVQNDMGGLCLWRKNNALTEYAYDKDAAKTVKEVLGDKSATVPGISQKQTTSKVSNSIKVKTARTVSYKKLKKKKQTFIIAATANGGAKITYSLKSAPKKLKKYISVSKAGKVTIEKGARQGSNKVKVNITADETNKYKKTTVVKTITVNIK